MTKAEVEVGAVYIVKHGGQLCKVRIGDAVVHRGVNKTVTHWMATKLSTGRTIEIKSATKLLRKVASAEDMKQ